MKIDMQLWHECQRIVYGKRRGWSPSSSPPFAPDHRQGPKRQPASWLYNQRVNNHALRVVPQ